MAVPAAGLTKAALDAAKAAAKAILVKAKARRGY